MASLMARGQDHVLKKVIEEAAEVLMASKDGRPEAFIYGWPIYGSMPSSLEVGMIFPPRKYSRNSSVVLGNPASVPTSSHPCTQPPSKVLDDIGFSC